MCVAGFLPFSAIYIELHYIFASMWGHQIYTLFGILFFAFILIVIVTGFNTVALLYFQLAREDHRWWWPVFINGGMTGIFIYAYSFYFYFHRTGMSGILQGSFYFGYMAIVSFAIFLMLGSVAFHFSLAFVRYIYGRIKCDWDSIFFHARFHPYGKHCYISNSLIIVFLWLFTTSSSWNVFVMCVFVSFHCALTRCLILVLRVWVGFHVEKPEGMHFLEYIFIYWHEPNKKA